MANDHELFLESLVKAAKGHQRGTVLGRRLWEVGEPPLVPPDDEDENEGSGTYIPQATDNPHDLLGPQAGMDAIQAKLARRFGGGQPVNITQQVQQIDDQIAALLAKKKRLVGGANVNSMGEIERPEV